MPRTPLLAAACAVVLLAAGCTPDDPKPNYSSVSTTPTTASPTPTASSASPNTTANLPPGSTKPSLPPSAGVRDASGAFAFSTFFWRILDWAYATNDAANLDGLFLASCKSCSTFRTSIATDVGAGYTLIGGRILIKSAKPATLAGGVVPAEFAFDVSVSVEPLEERTSGGVVATSYPASTSTQRTYVSWSNGAWAVVNTAVVK